MEHLSTPAEQFDQQPILTLVPMPEAPAEPEVDYFAVALHDPQPKSETLLTSDEIIDIRRERAEDVTPHFLASLILRLAGNDTTLEHFREYHAVRDKNNALQHNKQVTKKKLESTQQHLDEISEIANPYVQVYSRVLKYVEVVNQVRRGEGPQDMTIGKFFEEIYDRTDHLMETNSALKFIRGRQRELRETSVEAERLFRLMLVNPDL